MILVTQALWAFSLQTPQLYPVDVTPINTKEKNLRSEEEYYHFFSGFLILNTTMYIVGIIHTRQSFSANIAKSWFGM